MKAEDLTIGDWVDVYHELPDESGFYKPLQITGLHQNDGICFGDSIIEFPRNDPEEFEEEIKPIPLTSEILEKNGFKRLQDTYLFNITTNQFGVNLWLEIGPDSWIENNKIRVDSLKGDFNYPMLTVMSCKYVHEFQHLLKLYGIKKDIVL